MGDDTITICGRVAGCMYCLVVFRGHCLASSPTLRPIVVNLGLVHLHLLDLLGSLYFKLYLLDSLGSLGLLDLPHEQR